MANAVEKMFDMTLFNSLAHFPDHATNPDKFWEAIKEIEAELHKKIDIIEMGKDPCRGQIKIAKQFINAFKPCVKSNPFDWDRIKRITTGKECIEVYAAECVEFHFKVKKLFKYYVKCMVIAQNDKSTFRILA